MSGERCGHGWRVQCGLVAGHEGEHIAADESASPAPSAADEAEGVRQDSTALPGVGASGRRDPRSWHWCEAGSHPCWEPLAPEDCRNRAKHGEFYVHALTGQGGLAWIPAVRDENRVPQVVGLPPVPPGPQITEGDRDRLEDARRTIDALLARTPPDAHTPDSAVAPPAQPAAESDHDPIRAVAETAHDPAGVVLPLAPVAEERKRAADALFDVATFLHNCRGTEPWEFYRDHADTVDRAAALLRSPAESELAVACRKAAQRFREYEAMHAAKGAVDKAARNALYACELEAALAARSAPAVTAEVAQRGDLCEECGKDCDGEVVATVCDDCWAARSVPAGSSDARGYVNPETGRGASTNTLPCVPVAPAGPSAASDPPIPTRCATGDYMVTGVPEPLLGRSTGAWIGYDALRKLEEFAPAGEPQPVAPYGFVLERVDGRDEGSWESRRAWRLPPSMDAVDRPVEYRTVPLFRAPVAPAEPGLRAACERAAAWFREYEALHVAKGKHDRAEVNAERAAVMEAALGSPVDAERRVVEAAEKAEAMMGVAPAEQWGADEHEVLRVAVAHVAGNLDAFEGLDEDTVESVLAHLERSAPAGTGTDGEGGA